MELVYLVKSNWGKKTSSALLVQTEWTTVHLRSRQASGKKKKSSIFSLKWRQFQISNYRQNEKWFLLAGKNKQNDLQMNPVSQTILTESLEKKKILHKHVA